MKCLNGKCSQGIWDCCRDCEERSECSWVCSFADDKACDERISKIRNDMRNFEIEKRFSKNRFLISYRKKNKRDETMSVELFKIEPFWCMQVFVKDKNNIEEIGNNPMILNNKINKKWLLETTEENAVLLLKECERRFHAEDDFKWLP